MRFRLGRESLVVLLVVAAGAPIARAQSYIRASTDEHDAHALDVARTADGGYVMAGRCLLENEETSFDLQALVVKHDASGAIEWWTHYGDTDDQWATSIDVVPSGGYIVAGVEDSPDDLDLCVMRLDGAGAVLWAFTYEVCLDPSFVDPVRGDTFQPTVRALSDGNYLVVGAVPCEDEAFVLKLRGEGMPPFPAGTITYLRHHRVDSLGDPTLAYTDVHELADGDVLVSGSVLVRADLTYSQSTPALARIDPLGNPVWSNQYQLALGDPVMVGSAVDVTEDETVAALAIAGFSDPPLVFGITDWGSINWVDPADGSVYRTSSYVDFYPAPGGVAVRLDGDEYRAIAAGHSIVDENSDTACAARASVNAANPTLPGAGFQIRRLHFSDSTGRLEAVGAPTDDACNWLIAGSIEGAGPGTHEGFAAAITHEATTLCDGVDEMLGLGLSASMAREDFSIISFNQVFVDRIDWLDGPARPITLTNFAACTSQFCEGEQGCNEADLAEPFGSLDFSDVLAFLTAFGAMEPEADLAPPIGTFDFSDVLAFLTAFGAGCP